VWSFLTSVACAGTTGRAFATLSGVSALPTRILVVEDDPSTAAGIVRGLRAAGYVVELATRGYEATRLALTAAPDVIVLDLLLPEQNGFAILEQLQERCAAPILVLTARTELADRLRCFDLGAADFVAKPFFIEELVARIRSRLGVRADAPRRVVQWADVTIDLEGRTALASGVEAPLTRNEFDILAHLVQRPGRAVTRASLAERTALPSGERDERTVDSHVARVRKKLGQAAAAAIVTVWGIGYRFDPPDVRGGS
jgi:two-component system OmpR family response regulator